MTHWNPWHGCIKLGTGCNHCYVYQKDAEYGKDASKIRKTSKFNLPLQKNRKKEYKLMPEAEPVYVCMTSDFFLKDADEWRTEAWAMIKERQDLKFVIPTKRMRRVAAAFPKDWGEGYENVTILCSVENQNRADERIPELLNLQARHLGILAEPLLTQIRIEKYLESGRIEQVFCGGEYGTGARVCDFAWVLDLMNQCVAHDVPFRFLQTGSLLKKGDRVYHIEREEQEMQARRAGVDFPADPAGWQDEGVCTDPGNGKADAAGMERGCDEN